MDRSARRIVFLYRKSNNILLGGLANVNGITNNNFYAMIEILLVFESPYTLTHGDGGADEVPRDDAGMKPGNYYVDGKSTTHTHSQVC